MAAIPGDLNIGPGDPLDLDDLARVAENARRGDHVSGGMGGGSDTGGVVVHRDPPRRIWVRIGEHPSESASGNHYTWEAVYYAYSVETGYWDWVVNDQVQGSAFFDQVLAIEVDGNENVPELAIVEAIVSDDGDALLFQYRPPNGDSTGGTTNYNNQTINYNGSTNSIYGPSTTTTYNGALVVQGPYYQPPYSFATWTGNQNNLTLPAGNVRLRVATDQHFREVTGIDPGVNPAGRIVCLHNVGNYVILIVHASPLSIAGNQILTTTANWYWLAPGHEVTLWYDPAILYWRVSESSDERLGGVTTYAAWGASQDDWAINPYYEQHRVSATSAVDLTGIQHGRPGLRQRIVNHGETHTITLKHQNASSAATNRFDLPGAADLKLHPRSVVTLDYDGITERWRAVAYRDLFTEKQIVHATTSGVPTSTADFTREAEGVIRQTRDSNTLNPAHQQIRRRASAGNVQNGDVIAQYVGYGKVNGVDESLLGYIQLVYAGAGTQNDGRWELWALENGADNLGLTIHPDGYGEFGQANNANELLGTDADGKVVNVTYSAAILAGGAPAWIKITKTHAQLAAAALTNDIEVYSLPARGTLLGAYMNHTVAFTGGGMTTYSLDLGIAGNLAKYDGAYGVTGAPAAAGPFHSTPFANPVMEDGFAATSIRLSAACDVNLNTATAGSVDIYLLVSVLP